MRSITKRPIPPVLDQNHVAWLAAWLPDRANVYRRCKYRHPQIKAELKKETFNKCIYCESLLGATSPGQTEHIVPSTKNPNLHFTWTNLTRACEECNRRKNDYYEIGDEFINPYADAIDEEILHQGPLVFWKEGRDRAEASIRMLGLNADRHDLIIRKVQFLDHMQSQFDRMVRADEPLRSVLRLKLLEFGAESKEFSGMANAFLVARGLV